MHASGHGLCPSSLPCLSPFFIMAPINTQPQRMHLNVATLPGPLSVPALAPAGKKEYERAAALIA